MTSATVLTICRFALDFRLINFIFIYSGGIIAFIIEQFEKSLASLSFSCSRNLQFVIVRNTALLNKAPPSRSKLRTE